MAFQLILASSIMLLLLWPLLFVPPVHLAEAASIALPGCRDRCGKISIPYPFGITPGCHLEELFKIDCSSNGTPTLLSGLDVLQNSVEDGTVGVKSRVSSHCDASIMSFSDVGSINLVSTPFSFSSTRNRFTVVGCINIAYLVHDGFGVGGCMSICGTDKTLSIVNGSCTGINCCQAPIPSFLKVLNISLTSGPGVNGTRCKYAFLVNQRWFDTEVAMRHGNVSVVAEMGYVPVVLDWVVPNNTYGLILNNRSEELNFPDSDGWRPASCNAVHSADFNGSVVPCSCSQVAEGNPLCPKWLYRY